METKNVQISPGVLKIVIASSASMVVLWWWLMTSSPLEKNWHGCVDEADGCKSRVVKGECKNNREVMNKECRESCGFCDHFHSNCIDAHGSCKQWAESGECEANPSFMVKNCQRSCGTCVSCIAIHSPNIKTALHISDDTINSRLSYSNTNYLLSSTKESIWVLSHRSDLNTPLLRTTIPARSPCDSSLNGQWEYKDIEFKRSRFITVTEASCADRTAPLEIPEEVLSSNVVPVPGVHFYADYNLSTLKPVPESYKYPDNPAFYYPEDIKTAPKIQYYIVSHQPKAYYFPRFLTDEEADNIMDEAKKRLERSHVVPIKGKNSSGLDDVRTSSGCWLDNSHKSVEDVRRRILAMTGFDTDQTEKLQVLRYQLGQKYNSHLDYFDPHGAKDDEEKREMWRLKWNNNWNRAATFFLYLHTTEEGGETTLPRSNSGPQPSSMTDCTKGLRVRPIKGSAVLFYDMKPDKTQDEYSLHGGCPVIKGEKWGAPQWLHVKVRDEGASGGFW
eukprot:TRINITY_DN553_c6_g1_i2.p1 TRINITY_DN553_c6_g1~~TRINITY_DN553_c6_g1_i2.p1  ORF type:complete len:503 (+),score=55.35 TRINITY_DN553_c6_g1_i2:79-1587(+)